MVPARLAGAPLLRVQSDERLVDLVRDGNDAAFEAIVARYRRALLRYCSGFMSEARAEDAVQQALVSAYRSLRTSQGEMRLRPWLYRIAHNTALNAMRDRGLGHEQLPEEIDGLERPEEAFEKNERLRNVVTALGALPERQRDAIVLRELEGRSYDEIASELGVSDGSVRQLLNRARQTLRAGMTMVTPYGLLVRVPWGAPGESVAARVAEICGAGAGGAVATKLCATALVTGAVVGGVASSPSGGLDDGRARAKGGAGSGLVSGAAGGGWSGASAINPHSRDDGGRGRGGGSDGRGDDDRGRGREGREGRGSDDDRRRGRGRGRGEGDRGDDAGRHGPGSGGDGYEDGGSDRSGSGPGGSGSEDGGSGSGGGSAGGGSGGSGSGSSGSGSGSSSGSGSGSSSGSGSGSSSGSGSNSGSGGGGSGSSGDGSGSGGTSSGGSGSGGSGSGSSGSGSGSSDSDGD